MENPSLNISLLCLAPKYLDLILWACLLGFIGGWMCMNGPLIIMAFGPLFGLWPSSFFVSSRDHRPCHFMLQNLVKNLQKRSTSKIYVQT